MALCLRVYEASGPTSAVVGEGLIEQIDVAYYLVEDVVQLGLSDSSRCVVDARRDDGRQRRRWRRLTVDKQVAETRLEILGPVAVRADARLGTLWRRRPRHLTVKLDGEPARRRFAVLA